MRKINITALIFLVVGLLTSIGSWSGFPDGLSGGYLAIWIGYPLILISIVLFIIGFFKK